MTVSLILEEVEQTPPASSIFLLRCDGMAATILKTALLWSPFVVIKEGDDAPGSQAAVEVVKNLIDPLAGKKFLEQSFEEVILLAASSPEELAMREWSAALSPSPRPDSRPQEVYIAVSAVGLRTVQWCLKTVDRYFEGDDLHTVIGADRDEIEFLVRRIEEILAAGGAVDCSQ